MGLNAFDIVLFMYFIGFVLSSEGVDFKMNPKITIPIWENIKSIGLCDMNIAMYKLLYK
jgi:hypothetical protein